MLFEDFSRHHIHRLQVSLLCSMETNISCKHQRHAQKWRK